MPHYSYVADLTSLVRFHGVLLDTMDRELSWSPWSPNARDRGIRRERMRHGGSVRKSAGTGIEGRRRLGASEGPSCRDRAPGLPSSSSIRRSQAARGEKEEGIFAGRFVKNRMLSHAEYERPVTGGTKTAELAELAGLAELGNTRAGNEGARVRGNKGANELNPGQPW